MAIAQFRLREFRIGYDKVNQAPVFMMMDDTELALPGYAFDQEGKAYIFNRAGKVVPAIDKKGKQYYLKAYARDRNYDTLYVLEGNFPSNN